MGGLLFRIRPVLEPSTLSFEAQHAIANSSKTQNYHHPHYHHHHLSVQARAIWVLFQLSGAIVVEPQGQGEGRSTFRGPGRHLLL